MQHSPADIIRSYLISTGVCSMPSSVQVWPAYVNMLPDTVNDAIMISDLNGIRDGRNMRTGRTDEHQGLQIIIRSLQQPAGWQKSWAIGLVMDSTYCQGVTIDAAGYCIQNLSRRGGVTPLGMEQHFKTLERQEKEVKLRRFIFSINAITTIDDGYVPPDLEAGVPTTAVAFALTAETPSGTIDGSNMTFNILHTPSSATTFFLYKNGLLQRQGIDYNLTGSQVIFISPFQPKTGSTLQAIYTR